MLNVLECIFESVYFVYSILDRYKAERDRKCERVRNSSLGIIELMHNFT